LYAPFRAVVVIGASYSTDWQKQVSDWLVRSGCLYMIAWGPDCTTWDDSVDWSVCAEFDYGDIPDDRFVMTTWHENEPLDEVFWFAQFCANHPDVELRSSLIIHIAEAEDRLGLIERFEAAASLH
jgi:hypothetical protein